MYARCIPIVLLFLMVYSNTYSMEPHPEPATLTTKQLAKWCTPHASVKIHDKALSNNGFITEAEIKHICAFSIVARIPKELEPCTIPPYYMATCFESFDEISVAFPFYAYKAKHKEPLPIKIKKQLKSWIMLPNVTQQEKVTLAIHTGKTQIDTQYKLQKDIAKTLSLTSCNKAKGNLNNYDITLDVNGLIYLKKHLNNTFLAFHPGFNHIETLDLEACTGAILITQKHPEKNAPYTYYLFAPTPSGDMLKLNEICLMTMPQQPCVVGNYQESINLQLHA